MERRTFRAPNINGGRDEPDESEWVRQNNERYKHKRGCALPSFASTENRESKERKSQRDIVIQKPQLERPAVRHHSNQRDQKPWSAAGCSGYECESSPEKNQDRCRDGNFLSDVQSEDTAECGEKIVEQDIRPRMREPEARKFPARYRLRKPCVV